MAIALRSELNVSVSWFIFFYLVLFFIFYCEHLVAREPLSEPVWPVKRREFEFIVVKPRVGWIMQGGNIKVQLHGVGTHELVESFEQFVVIGPDEPHEGVNVKVGPLITHAAMWIILELGKVKVLMSQVKPFVHHLDDLGLAFGFGLTFGELLSNGSACGFEFTQRLKHLDIPALGSYSEYPGPMSDIIRIFLVITKSYHFNERSVDKIQIGCYSIIIPKTK